MFAVHLGWFKKPAALVVLLSLHLLNTVVLGFLLFHGSYTLAGHFFMCQIRLRLKKEREKNANRPFARRQSWPGRCFDENLVKLKVK